MGSKLAFGWACLLTCLMVLVTEVRGQVKFFNVMNYGAVADGATDNSEGFVRAWKEACEWKGRARVLIPQGTYMVSSGRFEGPCKGLMTVMIKGVLKAPTDPTKFSTENWINFRYVDRLTVSGGGTLDGQGQVAWRFNDCRDNPNCPALPTTMRFDFVTNARIHHLRSIDSKSNHLVIFGCENVNISSIRISAPGDSPNTDGIKIGHSHRIGIAHSTISTGDDCIAMLSGATKIHISNVVCGPGHGISIGSLGKNGDEDDVSGVVVRNCTFQGTSDGVRIKTWASPSLGRASDFIYEDIFMEHVGNPIIIDQEYCPYPPCNQEGSLVQISNVTYRNIWGISDSKVAVTLRCSGSRSCKNVVLEDINLAYRGPGGPATALCSHVNGRSLGHQTPPSCI
ncbi:exopolygalacturonase-like [Corylus avellana]|uniref:exopolygalacturonase-like n=1 Tax=Corylus avellana TaxID=13451 RepID=UPI001E21E830|nr:exopolygalacturonase-like [Corylus avellana]